MNLLDFLRRAGDMSVKAACREGHCGACMVLLDGRPRNACLLLAEQVRGAEVSTAGSLAGDPVREAVVRALVDEGAPQCGYCTPGVVVTLVGAVRRGVEPSEVDEVLSAHHCRCSGYYALRRAAHRVLAEAADVVEEGVAQ